MEKISHVNTFEAKYIIDQKIDPFLMKLELVVLA